jgi:hypothetical protein
MIINLVLDRCFTSPLSASEKSGPDGGISSLSRCHARPTPAKMRFSCDSPLERKGIELSVPGTESITKRSRVLREDYPPNQLKNNAAALL